MTDTKEMRDAFEAMMRTEKSLFPLDWNAGLGEFKSPGTQHMWNGYQAAWTRKPAEQVAGTEVAGWVNPDKLAKQCMCYATTMKATDAQVPFYYHPAPEPASVPVLAKQVVREMWEAACAAEDEGKGLAEDILTDAICASLAAERGWVK